MGIPKGAERTADAKVVNTCCTLDWIFTCTGMAGMVMILNQNFAIAYKWHFDDDCVERFVADDDLYGVAHCDV